MSMFPTRKSLFDVARRAVAETPNTRINPAVLDVPGSDTNLVAGIASVVGEEVAARGAVAMRGCFAELARGDQLDRLAADRYGLLRFGATPATVAVTLSRPLPGVATPGTFPAGSIVQTSGGIQFATDSDAVFGDFALSATVNCTAVVSGVEGNVAAGAIAAFDTSPFDATITVTNADGAAGGTDTESDIQFLGRIRGFFPTVARATMPAIEYAARQVAGVAVATATEVLNAFNALPAAAVQLVIGDRDGNASPAMIEAVSNELLEWRAGGIPVTVQGGTVFYQTVRWLPAFQTGYDETLAVARLRAVTVAVSQFLPPGPAGGTLYRSALLAAGKQVPGIILSDASLAYPLGDVVPTDVTQMIRILSEGVTFV